MEPDMFEQDSYPVELMRGLIITHTNTDIYIYESCQTIKKSILINHKVAAD